jgi:16S rRNA (adenine1518-N6/adenine1519-N6)-dimethyltransferase
MRQPAQLSDSAEEPSAGPSNGSERASLLGPADVRRLADRLGVRPTKQLGQNFVIDPNTIRRIVASARLRPDDVVVEVGPGLGSLTLGLLDAARRVVAVELDPVLAEALPGTIAERAPELAGNFEIVHGNALRLTELPGPAPTALVANLPYNVAVPVLLTMLERFPSLRRVLIMVQAEVADRLAAEPGGRVYGVPSVKARLVRRRPARGRHRPQRLLAVPARGVRPRGARAPRSAARGRLARKEVFAVVDAAFAQRRKTLRAALGGWAGSPGPGGGAAAPRREWIPARAGNPWAWQSMRRSRRRGPPRSRRSLRREGPGSYAAGRRSDQRSRPGDRRGGLGRGPVPA